MALAVTTLLAMSTTTSSINNSLPPVAYTKAIDVWTNLCVTFVFLALLEYALVNYAARYCLYTVWKFEKFSAWVAKNVWFSYCESECYDISCGRAYAMVTLKMLCTNGKESENRVAFLASLLFETNMFFKEKLQRKYPSAFNFWKKEVQWLKNSIHNRQKKI